MKYIFNFLLNYIKYFFDSVNLLFPSSLFWVLAQQKYLLFSITLQFKILLFFLFYLTFLFWFFSIIFWLNFPCFSYFCHKNIRIFPKVFFYVLFCGHTFWSRKNCFIFAMSFFVFVFI